MIMLLKHVINIISQWHLLVYVCSIINDFPPKKTLADFLNKMTDKSVLWALEAVVVFLHKSHKIV